MKHNSASTLKFLLGEFAKGANCGNNIFMMAS
jgi:hypothetical protein